MELIIKIQMPTQIDLAALLTAEKMGMKVDIVQIDNQGHIIEMPSILAAAKMIMEVRSIVDSMIRGQITGNYFGFMSIIFQKMYIISK